MALLRSLCKMWIAVFACIALANSMEINVTGPEGGLVGDFEKFVCELDGGDVSEKTEIKWKYSLQNGESPSVTDSEMLSPLEKRTFSEGKLQVTSFIMLRSDIRAIECEHSSSPDLKYSLTLKVIDIPAITSDHELCSKSKETGKPVVALYTYSMDPVTPYRKGHLLNGKEVPLSYPTDVSQARLVCVSNDDSPTWTLKPGTEENMRFAAWKEESYGTHGCKKQVVDILQVNGKPGGYVTKLSFECKSESSNSNSVPVELDFRFPFARYQPDFNQTENCINTIVEQFYGKELTGVGVGSSLVIILMMVGMAIMKKQMNQQKANQPPPTGGQDNQGANSTEPLTPSPSGANNA